MKLHTIIALLLTGGVLLSATGCGVPFSPTDSSAMVQPDKIDEDKYVADYRDNWQYRYLSADEQDDYGTMYTVLTDRFGQDATVTIQEDGQDREMTGVAVPLPHPLHSQEDAQRLYTAFFRDNPQFFYVSNRYGLEGYMERDVPHYDTLLLVYTMDAAQRKKAVEALEQKAEDILSGCPQTEDDYQKELYLHDRLAALCAYDDAAAKEEDDGLYPHAYTAYGALVNGQAVCEGYSKAMQYLLRRVQIPCTLVTGTSRETGEKHVWNLLTVNGRNYHLDVTWDDSEEYLSHAFMNLTTARLLNSHTMDEQQTGIDTCTATKDDYFIRNGAFVDTYHREDIAEMIAAELLRGNDTIELRFEADKFNNGLLFLKNTSLTKQMVNAVLAQQSTDTLWDYELFGRTEQHTLTLVKK